MASLVKYVPLEEDQMIKCSKLLEPKYPEEGVEVLLEHFNEYSEFVKASKAHTQKLEDDLASIKVKND
jgi:hypothetical protein